MLIVYKKVINMTEERVSGTPCHKRLIEQAQQRLRSSRTMDPAVKRGFKPQSAPHPPAAISSFIRPGSMSPTLPFHWSSITEYFVGLCNQFGGGTPSDQSLEKKLTELDQDITNGGTSSTGNGERPMDTGRRCLTPTSAAVSTL